MKKVLAFDIGGTNTRLALINEKFKIEKELITRTPIKDEEKFIENCLKMIDEFPLEDVVAIGAGVPGVVDRQNGIIIDLPNVFIKNVKFGDILKEKYNLPLYLRNDAEIACLGEAYLGAGKSHNRVFFITISTGLGGALCIDSKIQDYVTEIGHTAYVYKNNVTEYEKLVSGFNLKNLAKFNGFDEIKEAKEMFDGVRNQNENCLKLFDEWFSILNSFITLVTSSYYPDVICITGGLTKSKDLFYDKLQEKHPETKIVDCFFKEGAGLMGAGVYALQCAKII